MVLNEKNRMNNSDKNKFDNIKFKYLKNNKKYIFDFNEKDNYFGLGWSHNQNKPGAWSEGTTSTLFFRTNNEKEDLNLEIFFKPFLLKKKTTSEFDVYINNQFFKKVELKIKKTKYQKLEIIIKKELVNNGKIKIDFKFKDLKSPYDLLISPDSRKLGILVKSIEIV